MAWRHGFKLKHCYCHCYSDDICVYIDVATHGQMDGPTADPQTRCVIMVWSWPPKNDLFPACKLTSSASFDSLSQLKSSSHKRTQQRDALECLAWAECGALQDSNYTQHQSFLVEFIFHKSWRLPPQLKCADCLCRKRSWGDTAEVTKHESKWWVGKRQVKITSIGTGDKTEGRERHFKHELKQRRGTCFCFNYRTSEKKQQREWRLKCLYF